MSTILAQHYLSLGAGPVPRLFFGREQAIRVAGSQHFVVGQCSFVAVSNDNGCISSHLRLCGPHSKLPSTAAEQGSGGECKHGECVGMPLLGRVTPGSRATTCMLRLLLLLALLVLARPAFDHAESEGEETDCEKQASEGLAGTGRPHWGFRGPR